MGEGRASTFSALGLTLLGTTCCALPLTLVALGAGGAVASLVSAVPGLVWLSHYKAWTFGATALALGYAWWQVRRASMCEVAAARRLGGQIWVLRGSTVLFLLSVFAAYGLLPLTLWLEGGS